MEFFSGAMLLFVGFREGVFSYYSFWEERKYEGVGSALCRLKSFWPLLNDGMLRWKMSWNGRKYEIEVAKMEKNGKPWCFDSFTGTVSNFESQWYDMPILDSSSWAPLTLWISSQGNRVFWRGVTVSGVVPIRLNPTRSGKQGIIRSWFVVCGSMACHPGIIKLQYAFFFGESNLIQVDANLEGFPLWCMVRAGKITMPVAIQGHDFSPHPVKKRVGLLKQWKCGERYHSTKGARFARRGWGHDLCYVFVFFS